MKGYPKWFVPALIGTLLSMLVTGLLLAPTTLTLRTDLILPWRLSGSGRVVTAALHAAGGFALMLLVGALWSLHMRVGWRKRKQRASGLLVGVLLLTLAASAVAVYYLGDESTGAIAALFHLGAGLALVGPFGWHWVHGRRAARHAHPPLHVRAHAAPPTQHPVARPRLWHRRPTPRAEPHS